MISKPFGALTVAGKRRRLTALARKAISRFPIDVARLSFLAEHTNLLFRVDARDGARYALRVCAPGEHTRDDRQLEIAWIDALARETDLNLARPIAARDGDFIVMEAHDGVDAPRDCLLFTWVPGKSLDDDVLPPGVHARLGAILAKLHAHARVFALPGGAKPMRWDRAFYYEHEPTVVYDASHARLFTPTDLANIRATQTRVDALIAELWARPPGPHLIHTDLHSGNVHQFRGQLWIFDFEDLTLGTPAQDIASALYGARFHDPDYKRCAAEFQSGYESASPWPLRDERELETLIMARVLMFVNYCANRYDDDANMRRSLPNLLKRVANFVDADNAR
jgi:Ser/Thr protein kinase RdoA (MazF antagonist)